MNKILVMHDVTQGHGIVRALWDWAKPLLADGRKFTVKVSEPTRSLEQNAAQWPILEAFSRQLKWPVNGELVHMSPEEWKDVLTAAFRNETQRIAMGLNGGMVILGMRTSKMPRGMFSEWLEFLNATAAMRGVDLGRW